MHCDSSSARAFWIRRSFPTPYRFRSRCRRASLEDDLMRHDPANGRDALELIIVGAGLGGLTLANALVRQRSNIRITVLERDRGIASRPQGYGINLTQNGGLMALERLGVVVPAKALAPLQKGARFFTTPGAPPVTIPTQPSGPPVPATAGPRGPR